MTMTNETMDEIGILKKRIADAKHIIGCAIYFNDRSDYLSALYSAYRKLGGNDETINVDIPKEIHDEDGVYPVPSDDLCCDSIGPDGSKEEKAVTE